jgi:hypothetical protein
VNSGIVLWTGPWPLPPTFLPIDCPETSRQLKLYNLSSWSRRYINKSHLALGDRVKLVFWALPRAQVRSCGICGGQGGTGAGFFRVLRFPLPILIPPTAPHSSFVRGWYNRSNSGRHTKWTQPHSILRK